MRCVSDPRPDPAPPVPYAPYGPAVPPPVRPPAPRSRPLDVTVTILELLVLAMGALVASFFGLFLGMVSDGCGGSVQCDTGRIGAGVLVAAGSPWVVLLIATCWSTVRMVRRRVAFWVPLLAVPVWAGLLALGVALAVSGVPS